MANLKITSNPKLELQVENLTRRVDALQTLLGNVVSAKSTIESSHGLEKSSSERSRRRRTDSHYESRPIFSGPTSSTFAIDIATNILSPAVPTNPGTDVRVRSLMALESLSDEEMREEAATTSSSKSVEKKAHVNGRRLRIFPGDPTASAASSEDIKSAIIRVVGRRAGDALRLLESYQSVIGVLHPILDVSILETQVRCLYGGVIEACEQEDLYVLAMALAIALIVEGAGAQRQSDKVV